MIKAFIICTVRDATEEYRKKLEDFVKCMESNGIQCHLPHRDTNQKETGIITNEWFYGRVMKFHLNFTIKQFKNCN